MGHCREKITKEQSRAMGDVEKLIESSANILGYMPTPDDMLRLYAQTYVGAVPSAISGFLALHRTFGGKLLGLLLNILKATNGQWATTSNLLQQQLQSEYGTIEYGGAKNDLIEKTVTVSETAAGHRTYNWTTQTNDLYPGDIVAVGELDAEALPGTDPVKMYVERRSEITFRSVVFIGRLPEMLVNNMLRDSMLPEWPTKNTGFHDVCLLAEGETLRSVQQFIKSAKELKGKEEYYDLGFIRLMQLDDVIKDNPVYVQKQILEQRRLLSDVYMLGLSSIGLYTFQLKQSSSHHFANYVAAGRWIDPIGERTAIVVKSAQASLWTKWTSSLPTTRIDLPKFDVSKRRTRCSVLVPIRCMLDPHKQLYEDLKDVVTDIETDKMQLSHLVIKLENTKRRKESLEPQERDAAGLEYYDRVIANYEGDIRDLTEILKEREALKNRIFISLTELMNDVILLKSGSRYFCWDRASLTNILEQQTRSGEAPYDPVTLHPITAGSYKTITNRDLDRKLAVIAEGRAIKPIGKADMELSENLTTRMTRKMEQVVSRRLTEPIPLGGRVGEEKRARLEEEKAKAESLMPSHP